MPERRSSKWDTLNLPYVSFHPEHIPQGETIESMRARCRVEVVERYFDLVRRGIDEDRRARELAALAEEVAVRRNHWMRAAWSPPVASTPGDRPPTLLIVRIAMLAILGAILAGAVAVGAAPESIALIAVLTIVAAGVLFVAGRRNVQSAVARGDCPDCGYRLENLRSEIPPHELKGVWLGPKACPECGASWPMVPPPVFEK